MRIRLQGNGHIFQEIVAQYQRYIELGVLKEGEKLPSVRELALSLGINPNTVEKAYSVLSEEGYVTILPKKGAFVKKKQAQEDPLYAQIRQLRLSGISKEAILKAVEDIYSEDHHD